MRNTHAAVGLAFLLSNIAACDKGEDNPVLPGGKGGSATLRVNAKHHSRVIDSCRIYIKYGAADVPTFYDDSMKVSGAVGLTMATFAGLTKGKYYLYAKGWDPVLAEEVVGGLPFEITEEKTLDATVPVTEGH